MIFHLVDNSSRGNVFVIGAGSVVLKDIPPNIKKSGIIIVETERSEHLEEKYSGFKIFKEYFRHFEIRCTCKKKTSRRKS